MTQFTKRTTSPFRYDIVGSFLRPQELKDARAKFAQGEISRDELLKLKTNVSPTLSRKKKRLDYMP